MDSKQITKFIFWPIELAVVLLILVNGYFIFKTDYDPLFFYSYGMILGLIAFGLFTIAILPGMLTRLGIRSSIIQFLMTYRREFGKLMFLFAFGHYLTIKLFPMIVLNLPINFPLYQIMGFIGLTLTLPLFLTSTNWAQKKFGRYWKTLHSLVYIIVWFIFLHVALVQGISIVSVLIFLIAFMELFSILNHRFFRLNLHQVEAKS